jgi:16S rRNA (guanine527-N7)-methyltransferase
MDQITIAKLLEPFLAQSLAPAQLNNISTYINMLLRWNARINLTAIRNPEEIVTRHFGESLFCAQQIGAEKLCAQNLDARSPHERQPVVDIGSGAGFPGLPIKIFSSEIFLTLIESNQKKVAFLREVIRELDLKDATVFPGRAEDFAPTSPNNVVTLRAVERLSDILPTALRLAGPNGSLALLIGEDQVPSTRDLAPDIKWQVPVPIPLSQHRVILLGNAMMP